MSAYTGPIVAVDFDGVIHSYDKGWQDGTIYGTVVPGFWEWLEAATETGLKVYIVSSRLNSQEGMADMDAWLRKEWHEHCTKVRKIKPIPLLTYSMTRPPAVMSIDDRGFRFTGVWTDAALQPAAIKAFRPWNVKEK